MGQPLRQVDPVGPQDAGEAGVRAHQEPELARTRDGGEAASPRSGLGRPEGAVDHGRARRQPGGDGLRLGGADRIGEEQQRRQGLSPAAAAA